MEVSKLTIFISAYRTGGGGVPLDALLKVFKTLKEHFWYVPPSLPPSLHFPLTHHHSPPFPPSLPPSFSTGRNT